MTNDLSDVRRAMAGPPSYAIAEEYAQEVLNKMIAAIGKHIGGTISHGYNTVIPFEGHPGMRVITLKQLKGVIPGLEFYIIPPGIPNAYSIPAEIHVVILSESQEIARSNFQDRETITTQMSIFLNFDGLVKMTKILTMLERAWEIANEVSVQWIADKINELSPETEDKPDPLGSDGMVYILMEPKETA